MGEILQANLFAWETLSQLHTHCHRFSAVIPQPLAAVCVVSAPGCSGAAMGTGSLSLTFLCLSLGDASPCVPFPPMIQSPSSCSKRSFMQNLEPLLGPGKLHRPPPAAASPTPLLVLLFPLGFLLASQSVLAGTQRAFCDLCKPTRDSCRLKHRPLAHRHSPW